MICSVVGLMRPHWWCTVYNGGIRRVADDSEPRALSMVPASWIWATKSITFIYSLSSCWHADVLPIHFPYVDCNLSNLSHRLFLIYTCRQSFPFLAKENNVFLFLKKNPQRRNDSISVRYFCQSIIIYCFYSSLHSTQCFIISADRLFI